jgi:hypothetical protein
VLPLVSVLALPSPAAELSLDRALAMALTGPAATQAGLVMDQASASVTLARVLGLAPFRALGLSLSGITILQCLI